MSLTPPSSPHRSLPHLGGTDQEMTDASPFPTTPPPTRRHPRTFSLDTPDGAASTTSSSTFPFSPLSSFRSPPPGFFLGEPPKKQVKLTPSQSPNTSESPSGTPPQSQVSKLALAKLGRLASRSNSPFRVRAESSSSPPSLSSTSSIRTPLSHAHHFNRGGDKSLTTPPQSPGSPQSQSPLKLCPKAPIRNAASFGRELHARAPTGNLLSAKSLFGHQMIGAVSASSSATPLTKEESHRQSLRRQIQDESLKSVADFIINAEKIHSTTAIDGTKTLHRPDGSTFTLTPIPGAKGEHNQIYQVEGSTPLIPGKSNNAVLIRLFHPEMFQKVNGIASSLKEIRESNIEMQITGIPTIPILNQATMLTDGFLAVEKIPNSFKLTADKMPSMRNILEGCYVYDINADAHHGTQVNKYTDTNFRCREDGEPLLCDWMEEEKDHDRGAGSRFDPMVTNILKSLVHGDLKQTDTMANLDPRILDIEWDANTPLPNLSEKNLVDFLVTVRKTKASLRDQVIRNECTVETAKQHFQESVIHEKQEFGLLPLSLRAIHNLCELKNGAGIVTQFRKGNTLFPIDRSDPEKTLLSAKEIANENPAVLASLQESRPG